MAMSELGPGIGANLAHIASLKDTLTEQSTSQNSTRAKTPSAQVEKIDTLPSAVREDRAFLTENARLLDETAGLIQDLSLLSITATQTNLDNADRDDLQRDFETTRAELETNINLLNKDLFEAGITLTHVPKTSIAGDKPTLQNLELQSNDVDLKTAANAEATTIKLASAFQDIVTKGEDIPFIEKKLLLGNSRRQSQYLDISASLRSFHQTDILKNFIDFIA